MEYSPKLAAFGRELTLEYFANDLEVGSYFIIRPHGELDKLGIPIFIVDGEFWGKYGLSNHWKYQVVNPDGTLQEEIFSSYGSRVPHWMKVSKQDAVNMAMLIYEQGIDCPITMEYMEQRGLFFKQQPSHSSA